MKFTVRISKKILLNASFVGLSDEEEFTFLNTAKPSGESADLLDGSKVLYFPVWRVFP